jgi:hypothetical protein
MPVSTARPRESFDAALPPDALRVRVPRLDRMSAEDWAAAAGPFDRYGAVVLSGEVAVPARDALLALAPALGPDPSTAAREQDGVLEIHGVREVFDYGAGDAALFPEHPLHTDGLAGGRPVMAMALQCEIAEARGGFSEIASARRLHAELAARDPAALAGLFAPDAFTVRVRDRVQPSPVFEWMGGRLAMRLKPPRYAEVSVSPGAAAGMALLQALLDEARMRVELRLQPGEILLADNTAVLHGRTPMPRDGVRKLNRLLFDGTGAVAPALTFGFLPEAA